MLLLSDAVTISIFGGIFGIMSTVIVFLGNRNKQLSDINKNKSEIRSNDAMSESSTINDMAVINKLEKELRAYFEKNYKELVKKYDELLVAVGKKVSGETYLQVVEERDELLRVSETQKTKIRKLETDVRDLKQQVEKLIAQHKDE